jgi:multiple sugar transport system permease protein
MAVHNNALPAASHASRLTIPKLSTVALYTGLVLLTIVFCAPFVWLVLTSLKPADEIFGSNWIPSEWRWENYADVFDSAPVLRWMWNTLVVTVLVIGTYLLPGAVTMIPTFLIWNELGAVNTFWPLWAGNLFGSAFYIFMLRQFMLTIPQDLVDSARIDGAGFLRIYWNLMLPLVRPALVAVAIFEANAKWDDFMGPLIYLNSPDSYTLALGLASLKASFQELGAQWSLLMAASVIFTVPMIALFFMFQRYFMEGVTHTGIKG